MATKELNNLIEMLNSLSEEKQKDVVNSIMNMMRTNATETKKFTCNDLVKDHTFKDGRPNCPHCHARASLGFIMKKGFKANGAQRFYCKACKHFFVATTNTAFEGSRKDPEVWEKFIKLTISGQSLKTCAEECGISIPTAFTWRHKILNAFRVHQESVKLSGKIELDEMLIPISYKGNHIKGAFGGRKMGPGVDNNLPRKSYKRGSDNKPTSSKEKACVFCMTKNGNEAFYAAVPGVGFMLPPMLDKTVGQHVIKDSSLLLADQYNATRKYFEDNNYKHILLKSNTSDNQHGHKPEIRDEYHLQHVNAMHHHIRTFLRLYCGVSTKYLENYISLYVWLKNIAANNQKKQKVKVSVSRMSASDCYVSGREIKARPAVPMCA